ncbi:MAG: biopolymer transport protein ExbB, partial [Candidatus Omnitrophota bacterium]
MSGIWEMNTWALIKAGGPIMAPILLCSLFAIGIIIEKLLYFAMIQNNPKKLKEKTFELIKNNKIKDALLICDASRSPVAKVLKAGIVKFGSSKEEIKENIEEARLFEIPRL